MYGDHSWGSSQLHYASYFVWFSYQGVDSGVVGVTCGLGEALFLHKAYYTKIRLLIIIFE